MPYAAVTGWGKATPERVLTNQDLERMVETSDEWIVSRTGIRARHVVGKQDSTTSIATAAEAHAVDWPERPAQGVSIAEADDLAVECAGVRRFDRHPAPDAQLAHRSDDFDQQTLDRLHAAEDLDVFDRLDSRQQGFHALRLLRIAAASKVTER